MTTGASIAIPTVSHAFREAISAAPARHSAATLAAVELEEWHRWWKTRGAQELRMLLMTHWDPIGVNGIPEAADEYDSYLGGLAEKLREGAGARGVCEYLSEIQTERMELPATPDELTDVGERVADWYAVEMQG
jgi:hypothetical protein